MIVTKIKIVALTEKGQECFRSNISLGLLRDLYQSEDKVNCACQGENHEYVQMSFAFTSKLYWSSVNGIWIHHDHSTYTRICKQQHGYCDETTEKDMFDQL